MAQNQGGYLANDFIEQANENKELTDLIIASIDKAMEKTNVATLAYVVENTFEQKDGYGMIKVKPFPLDEGQNEYMLDVICASNDKNSLTNNKIVVVLFIDKNFKNNLTLGKPQKAKTETLHSISQGVIIKIL